VLTGGGIFVVVDQVQFVRPIVGTSLVYEGAVIITVASGLTVLVAFLGCCTSRSASNRNLTALVSLVTRTSQHDRNVLYGHHSVTTVSI